MITTPAHATAEQVNTSTQKSTGFESGSLLPFVQCNTTAPSSVHVLTKQDGKLAKAYWAQSGYNGTRNTKGAELCAADFTTNKEGWYGFKLYMPTPGYPTDKEAAIAQVFQRGDCNSWAAHLLIKNNDLVVSHRSYCGTPTVTTLVKNFQRNSWHAVVLHFVLSHKNAGAVEVWVDQRKVYSKTNTNFGFGNWTSEDKLQPDSLMGLKLGQYAYDSTHYTVGETRELYYDNVAWLAGNPTGAFKLVSP